MYREKYLKYKNKYLNLQRIQMGGTLEQVKIKNSVYTSSKFPTES